MIGVPGPRLSPEFAPVIESTELGRSLPRFVASAIASRISRCITIWFAPTGVWISKVGMPVSWQIGPSVSHAISILVAMTASAVPALVAGFSSATALAIAARTSGGRLVEVSVIRLMMLSLNDCIALLRIQGSSAFLGVLCGLLSQDFQPQRTPRSAEELPAFESSVSPPIANKKGGLSLPFVITDRA